MRTRRGAVLGLLVVVAYAPASRADEPVETVRIRLEGRAACIEERGFFEEVRARTSRVRLAEPGEAGRTFVVALREAGSTTVGTLSILDGETSSAPRTVSGHSCADAVAALAFIAALSVDPAAHAKLASPPIAPASPPPLPPPSPTWPPAISIEALPASPPASLQTVPTPTASRPSASSPLFGALGAGVSGAAPGSPSSGFGGRAFVEGGSASSRLFAPTGRFSFDLPSQLTVTRTAGDGTLTWTRGSLDGCLVRFRLSSWLSAVPCAGVEAGVLTAVGKNIVDARTQTRPWVAGFAEARLRATYWRFLFAELDVGPEVPFVREQFIFLPATGVYQASPALVRGLLALGARFP